MPRYRTEANLSPWPSFGVEDQDIEKEVFQMADENKYKTHPKGRPQV